MTHESFQACIDACNKCMVSCEDSLTICLQQKDIKPFARAMKLERYCADMCRMAAAFMARSDENTQTFVNKFTTLCAEICEACAEECGKQPKLKHLQKCSDACEACAQECRKMELQLA